MTRQIVLLSIVTACLTLNSTVLATIRKVPSQYPTIQAGIDAAINGDVVIIDPNTYTGPGNRDIDFKGKAITVRSIDPDDPCVVAATVIDCENSGRGFHFHSDEEDNSVLAGFTIKRGRVSGNPAMGGGILCSGSSPTIKNCVITSNSALGSYEEPHGGSAHGGGIYCNNASPTVVNCRIVDNSALGLDCGGACPPGYAYGGGISCVSNSHLTIIRCNISGNLAKATKWILESCADGYGGGIYCNSNSTVTVYDSIITANTAQGGRGCSSASWINWPCNSYGGGIYINESSISSIKNCLITNNNTVVAVGEDYDGLHYGQSNGAGIYCGSQSYINNCSICDNDTDPTNTGVLGEGGGIYGTPTVEDSIIWENIATNQIQDGARVYYSDVQGGYAGVGNINADPFFVTGSLGDYYLSQIAAGQASDSPCVDAGSDTAANLGMDTFTTRTDGVIDTGVVDMGYHYTSHFGSVDIDENYHVDCFDYSILAADWRKCSEESYLPGDIIRDTCVNGKDLKVLAECWLDCYVTKANHPQPAHQTKCVDPNVTLSWVPGEGALLHDVYLGTDANAVANAGHLSPQFMGTVSDPNFELSGLELRTTYFWRIDELGPACTTQGVVWNFKTYDDDDCSPKAWWKFDEGSETIVYDSAGTNDGTIYGAAWTTGQIDGALDFDGVDDYVLVSDSDSISVGNQDYTICAWVYPKSMPTESAPMVVVSKVKDRADKEYCLSVHNGILGLGVETNSNNQFAQTTTSPVTINSWQFIVVVFDSSITTPTFYHNGQIQPSDNIIDTLPDSLSDDLYIGLLGGVYQSNPFDGMIDDVRIYNRVLTAGEILQLYQYGLN